MNKQKKSWTDFQRNLGRIFNSKNPKSWTDFQLHSIYIYMLLGQFGAPPNHPFWTSFKGQFEAPPKKKALVPQNGAYGKHF